MQNSPSIEDPDKKDEGALTMPDSYAGKLPQLNFSTMTEIFITNYYCS
jgi:hypothetical protein